MAGPAHTSTGVVRGFAQVGRQDSSCRAEE